MAPDQSGGRKGKRAMDEEEEDWRQLLEQYLPPPRGEQEDEEPPDDAPWRAALREAARHAPPPTTPTAERGRATRGKGQGTEHGADRPTPDRPAARAGDRVVITSLAGLRGAVVTVRGNLAVVETATARIEVRLDDLLITAPGPDPFSRPGQAVLARRRHPGTDDRTLPVSGGSGARRRQRWHGIDLHGLPPAEALDRLDDFLYGAWEDERLTVAVVHGKGAGKLRRAVRALLAAHPAVRHSHGAPPDSGGEGVTIVHLHGPSEHVVLRAPTT